MKKPNITFDNFIMNYFPPIIIFVLFITLILSEKYAMVLFVILFIGFFVIVVKSNKYPRLTKLFDDAF